MSQNLFRLTKKYDAALVSEGSHPATITLNKAADEDPNGWGGLVRSAFEIEILRGSRTVLADGQVEYQLELDDEKADLLGQWLTMAYFQPTQN